MRKNGFTMVEVVIAMTLMILALTSFVGAFVAAKRSAVISENRMEGVHNARQQMEQLLTYRYVDPLLNVGAHTTGMASVRYGVAVVTTSQYTVKNIAVTSKWINPAGNITSVLVLSGSISSELHQ